MYTVLSATKFHGYNKDGPGLRTTIIEVTFTLRCEIFKVVFYTLY